MKTINCYGLLRYFTTIIWFIMLALTATQGNLLGCLLDQFQNATSQVVYTPNDSSYMSILGFSIQNLRFTSSDTPKPLAIITPLLESHIGKAIFCCQKIGVQIRARSGGHDFEGLSFASHSPFVLMDLFNLRSIAVDVKSKTTWAQAGATVGELYYAIGNASRTLAFPAGVCPTVCLGGLISGGGYGMLVRKFGVAADYVVDARMVDAKGRILDRKSMGKDVFWAIRGGGGGSYGVIVAWKLKLVTVSKIGTVFTISKTLKQNANQLFHRWQYIAPETDENLLIRVYLTNLNTETGKTIVATFSTLFLGTTDALLLLMKSDFPELGLKREDCTEMGWVESVAYFAQENSIDYLRNRIYRHKGYLKIKSDFVTEPIPHEGLEGIWKRYIQEETDAPLMVLTPFGGKMNEISSSKIPFPHRYGNIYLIYHQVQWRQGEKADGHLSWLQEFHNFLAPYVSKNPRRAYVNYRDLDVGINSKENITIAEASRWGIRYFSGNFGRLVKAKTLVDPGNFFRHEQSIPSQTIQDNIRYLKDSKAST